MIMNWLKSVGMKALGVWLTSFTGLLITILADGVLPVDPVDWEHVALVPVLAALTTVLLPAFQRLGNMLSRTEVPDLER